MKETTDKWYSTKMLISFIVILLLINGLINLRFNSDSKVYISEIGEIEDSTYPIHVTILKPKKPEQKKQLIKEQEINITDKPIVELDSVMDQTIDIEYVPTTNVDSSSTYEGTLMASNNKPVIDTFIDKPVENILTFAEQMPEFPGGTKALLRYLSRKINYPMFEQEVGLEGRVYANFVVQPSGKIGEIEIVRSPSDGFSKETLRVIAKMPDWTPGYHNGNAVAVRYSLPINFKLN